ncbi:MAG: Mrp/NBP35 family ATP-binding protein [Salinivirgaceae bacterium]|nr:Mrp/NBP35 family ATP-binding protein [Salinivirgaceae bacterium]
MIYTTDKVFRALRKVIHPELTKDIISLGMVSDLVIEGNKISFTLVFKKENTTNIANLKQRCVQVIENNFGSEVDIRGNINATTVKEEASKPLEKVKNIIAIASGKGGVGKSTIASNLAVALANTGAKVGLVDADIFGPSIPKMFNCETARPNVHKVNGLDVITPIEKFGVKILSIGFFANPEDALVWRGPMASNALTQLLMQGDWGELDYLLIDLPPGTSDIHLTLVQSVAVTGAVVVSTPQDVALADAIKGINMFKSGKINVPVLGLVENMAWFTPAELPENKYYIFGKNGCKELAEKLNLDLLGQIPIVQSIREGGDTGIPVAANADSITGMAFVEMAEKVMNAVKARNEKHIATEKVFVDPNAQGCAPAK